MKPKDPTKTLLFDWARRDPFIRELMIDRMIENQIDEDVLEKKNKELEVQIDSELADFHRNHYWQDD